MTPSPKKRGRPPLPPEARKSRTHATTPAPDGGFEARLAVRAFLDLIPFHESLPMGAASEAVDKLRARGHKVTRAYMSQLLAGKRLFTPAMRAKLEKQ